MNHVRQIHQQIQRLGAQLSLIEHAHETLRDEIDPVRRTTYCAAIKEAVGAIRRDQQALAEDAEALAAARRSRFKVIAGGVADDAPPSPNTATP